jgi:hypothetical protein
LKRHAFLRQREQNVNTSNAKKDAKKEKKPLKSAAIAPIYNSWEGKNAKPDT